MAKVRRKKPLTSFQRAKRAAQLGIEQMSLCQTTRGWREVKSIRGTRNVRKSIGVVGRGWLMYGVLAHSDRKNKWFQKWFESVELARAYAKKRGWWLKVPAERLEWADDDTGRKTIKGVPIVSRSLRSF